VIEQFAYAECELVAAEGLLDETRAGAECPASDRRVLGVSRTRSSACDATAQRSACRVTAKCAVTLPSKLTTYLPRDVFLCFSTFFATSTGLSSDVPEAAALSFCFLVAIAVSASRASVSRTVSCSAARCSCRESRRARAPLRQPAPPSLPRWAHSRCHHRFCGSAAWDGDVKQGARPG
jgi:hypothetical protein